MVSTLKCSLAVVVMISLACSAYAIKCYECDSSECEQDIEADDNLLVDCYQDTYLLGFFKVPGAIGCLKRIFESADGHREIVRKCYYGTFKNVQRRCTVKSWFRFDKMVFCDVCTEDKCNG